MRNYDGVDVSSLTIEDALSDAEWGKQPADFFDYVGYARFVTEAMVQDFSDKEIVLTVRAVGLYCTTGQMPDTSSDEYTAASKMAIRATIESHKAKLEKVYLERYKKFVGGKKGRRS